MSEERNLVNFSLKGKKGAAFTLREEGQKGSWVENMPRVAALRPHWNYSWGPQRLDDDRQPPRIEFLPMIWGYNPKMLPNQMEMIGTQNPTMLLGFNEPDQKNQSNMTVEKALEAWPKLEAMGVPLVSPSCAHPMREWMEAFMDQAQQRGLRVDAIGFHDYGGGNAGNFQTKLRNIYEKYQRPILVTEFAVADWNAKTPETNKHKPEQVLKFMQEVLPWMEEQDWILGYAWFSFNEASAAGTCSALFHEEGNLTDLGRFYAEFNPNTELEVWTP
jgi:hypothetical protein